MSYSFVLLLFAISVGYFIGKYLSKTLYKFQHKATQHTFFSKYHIHHSLGGLVTILIAFLFSNPSIKITLIGIGFGVLLHHVLKEGFTLITKDNDKKN